MPSCTSSGRGGNTSAPTTGSPARPPTGSGRCAWASARPDEMVAALGPVEYADIEIELFRVEIDGGVFGLVDVSRPQDGPAFAERVLLVPTGLLFRPPWDGNYDT